MQTRVTCDNIAVGDKVRIVDGGGPRGYEGMDVVATVSWLDPDKTGCRIYCDAWRGVGWGRDNAEWWKSYDNLVLEPADTPAPTPVTDDGVAAIREALVAKLRDATPATLIPVAEALGMRVRETITYSLVPRADARDA